MSNELIAVLVGHSRGDGGAVSVGGVSEWNFNRVVARHVKGALDDMGVDCVVIDQYQKTSYGRAMKALAKTLKEMSVTAAIELHFNDGPETATGHEWLHWATSAPGRKLAQCLNAQFTRDHDNLKQRGLVPISTATKRGGQFLVGTHCPAVICEPFFGSNRHDWYYASNHQKQFGESLARAVRTWMGGGK